jgi:Fur family ferric uptake transcriptional regulator
MAQSTVSTMLHRLETRHRITVSRIAVIGLVASMPGHFSVEDVLAQSRGIGRATVFRTLKLLVDEGLICRVLLEDGRLHYRVSHDTHHHHLVCKECGAVEDFTTCDLEGLIAGLSVRTGFDITSHWLEFYGLCRTCRETVPASRNAILTPS